MLNDLINFIKELGFPIFVSVWLLLKESGDKEKMRQSIDNQTTAIQELKDIIKDLKDFCLPNRKVG